MEADGGSAPPSAALTTRFRQKQLAQRENSVRDQTRQQGKSQRGRRAKLDKDGETATMTFGASGAGNGKQKTRTLPSTLPKSLLPVNERKSQEDNLSTWRAKKGSQEDDKWDLTPDGGSAGREGRQFAVANVGNNGRIYLR
jgi:hypothetical protein